MRISDWSSDVCSSDLDASILLQSLYGAVRAGRISTNAAATGVPPDTQDEAASSDANGSIEVNGDLIQLGDVSSHAEASDAGRYANDDIRLSDGYYAQLVDFHATARSGKQYGADTSGSDRADHGGDG